MAFLLPTTKTSVSQGQTSEFAVTNSAYDETISKIVGTQRLPGNIIWADNIREERTEDVQTSGGKGSPKQETTTVTYQYFVDVAVMFSKGEAESLRRIWADGKLIYDALGSNIETLSGLSFTAYLGTETQLPNSTIEAAVGVNNTPAYRGLVYIVFDDFPLANFGNRIPAITAEFAYGSQNATVTARSATGDVTRNGDEISNDGAFDGILHRSRNGRFYWRTGGVDNEAFSALFNSNGTITDIRSEDDNLDGVFGDKARILYDIDSTGKIFAQQFGTTGVQGRHYSYNATYYPIDRNGNFQQFAFLPGNESWAIARFNSTAGLDEPTGTVMLNLAALVTDPSPPDRNFQAMFYEIKHTGDLDGGLCFAGRTGEGWAVSIDANDNVRTLIGTSSALTQISLVSHADIDPGSTGFDHNRSMWAAYDPTGDRLICFKPTFETSGLMFAINRDGSFDTLATDLPFIPNDEDTLFAKCAQLEGGEAVVWSNGGLEVCRFILSSNTLDPNFNGTGGLLGLDENGDPLTNPTGENTQAVDEADNTVWDETTNTFWTQNGLNNQFERPFIYAYTFSTGAGEDTSAVDVIQAVADEVELSSSDLNLTNLSSAEVGVKSYKLDSREEAGTLLQPYLTTLQIDVADTDSQVEFVKRGLKSTSFTVPQDDMIPSSDIDGEPYVRARVTENDIPRRIEVSYDDVDNQYQAGLQADERSTNATTARGLETQDYPGAMTADGARDRAQLLLYERWSQQERFSTNLPWKYVAINPTDVGTFQLSNGDELRVRCVKADLGADFTIDFEGVIEGVDIGVSSGITGTAGDGNQVTSPAVIGDSNVFIWDTPLLRDSDEPSSSGQIPNYWSGAQGDNWPGAFLYLQTTDTIVEQLGKQINPVPYGVITTAPGDPTTTTRFDEDASMVVTITDGEDFFASVNEIDVLNGANVLLVQKANGEVEFLQFQNVEVDSGNSQVLTLSRLLRGRRGTETMANGLAAGDEVYLMISGTYVNLYERDISTIDTEFTFRGVTVGQIFEEGDTFTFTSEGRTLMPYAPVDIEVTQPGGTSASDLVFTWTRRTRIGGTDDLDTTATDVPLSEDSESYELVIYTDDTYTGEAIVKSVTEETATVTQAEILLLVGGVSTIYFRVYQLSSQVGRGFATDQSTPTSL